MKCVISVLGKDRSGIVAAVSVALAECGANIDDISQTILGDMFSMTMLTTLDTEKADFNAVICAVLLLLLIWAMDYLFSLCFKKNDLGISEKKRYIFMAYVGACISGFIIASRDASKMALEIPNITISVLIGAYVPFTLLLEDGKKGKVELQSMKEEWEEKYKKTFRERKVKDILSALLFAMVYGVLLVGALSPAQNIINDIASGIGMGMATVVVAFVGLVEVKNRLTKRRNKREDADQEKSDTE